MSTEGTAAGHFETMTDDPYRGNGPGFVQKRPLPPGVEITKDGIRVPGDLTISTPAIDELVAAVKGLAAERDMRRETMRVAADQMEAWAVTLRKLAES